MAGTSCATPGSFFNCVYGLSKNFLFQAGNAQVAETSMYKLTSEARLKRFVPKARENTLLSCCNKMFFFTFKDKAYTLNYLWSRSLGHGLENFEKKKWWMGRPEEIRTPKEEAADRAALPAKNAITPQNKKTVQ